MKHKNAKSKLSKRTKVRSSRIVRPVAYHYWSVQWRIGGTYHSLSTGRDAAATHAASVILAGADVLNVVKSKCKV